MKLEGLQTDISWDWRFESCRGHGQGVRSNHYIGGYIKVDNPLSTRPMIERDELPNKEIIIKE